MLITLARIIGVIFSILAISKSYLSLKAKNESLTMTIFWTATWLIILAVAFFPQLINIAIGGPGAKTGVGTVLGIGLVFVYFVIYRVYIKADRVEKQLRKLIRDHALDADGAQQLPDK